jgi:hypothetical protein
MFPSEAIRVVVNTPSKVVIVDPPYYSLGTWMLFLASCTMIICFILLRRSIMPPVTLLLLFVTLGLGLFGGYLISSRTTTTLTKEEGWLKSQRELYGIKRPETGVRLSDIRRVTVETVQYNHRLMLIMKSGDNFAVGDGSNRQGYYGAADAINDFIGAPRAQ